MPREKSGRVKIYVACVLALALAVMGYFQFFHGRARAHSDRLPPPLKLTDFTVPEVKTENSQERARGHKWPVKESMYVVTRDIFAPAALPPRAATQSSGQGALEPAPTLRLRGVIVGGGSSIAIINDQFLRTGDRIGSYRVVRIAEKEVLLSSARKTLRLQLVKND